MRIALKEDLEDLERLEIALFPENCFNEYSLAIELDHGKCWVEERDGKVVAYLLARIIGDLVDVLRVGVLPGYRRSGIADRLMNVAMREAPNTMLMVRKNNPGAIKLYLQLGFEIDGQTEDSWTMLRTCGY